MLVNVFLSFYLSVFNALFNQPHLAQRYRITLMLKGVHESKIYFEVQLGVNKLERENIHHMSRCIVEHIVHTEV